MRNMSFAHTASQLLAGTKTVTRRAGWRFLKPADRVRAVRKSRGLRPGETIEPLCVLEVINVSLEPLHRITADEVVREGFPQMTPADFVAMFCDTHKGCTPDTEITRIEFRLVPAHLVPSQES